MMKEELEKIKEFLLTNTDRFYQVMDISPFMLWLTDKNITVYVNKSWLLFTGKTIETEIGKDRFEDIHPDDVAQYKKLTDKSFETHSYYEIKYRLKHRSGKYKWIFEQGRPLINKDGGFRGFVGGCIDIDAQRKKELNLKFSEERYRRLFETARDGILILDATTAEITDVNPFLEELLGYSKEEFLGKKLWEVGAFKNTVKSKEVFKKVQEVGFDKHENLPLETKDGKLIEVGFVSNAYMVGNERVIQCNIRDISERKRAEEADKALIQLKQEQLKNAFIADVTHELRTPLAIIKGNVELALRDKKTVQVKTFKAINVEVNHLSEMLSNLAILTSEDEKIYSKVEQQKLNIAPIVTKITKRLEMIGRTHAIELELEKIPKAMVLGNEENLEKLFSNIIRNGIFYSEKDGKVTISGEKTGTSIIIRISNTGKGIAEEDIPKLFRRFYRTEDARAVNQEGRGLGLAISKWIAEAHKGSITAESEVGKGTTFTITLPLQL